MSSQKVFSLKTTVVSVTHIYCRKEPRQKLKVTKNIKTGKGSWYSRFSDWFCTVNTVTYIEKNLWCVGKYAIINV